METQKSSKHSPPKPPIGMRLCRNAEKNVPRMFVSTKPQENSQKTFKQNPIAIPLLGGNCVKSERSI